MDKQESIETISINNNTELDFAVVDIKAHALKKRGVLLDDYMLEALRNRKVLEDCAEKNEQDTKQKENAISKQILEKIDRLTVEDCAKVELTEGVKKRVVQGISYLYNNIDSENFVDATNSIAGDLQKAILENDAIAIDINALRVSDEYTFKHSVDVATMAMVIGKAYGLSDYEVHEIGIAGLLHDIGKTKVPSNILNKPERLTDAEFEIMKQHSLYGYKILEKKGQLSRPILLGVLQHHEKLNGRGYPLGIPEEKICMYAKILSVVDIYDALVTERVYKKAFSPRDAVEMIMAMTDELDIDVVRSFLCSVILYPVGSTVVLSNGEKAKVIENEMQCTFRPKVIGLETGTIYNLSEDMWSANIVIL